MVAHSGWKAQVITGTYCVTAGATFSSTDVLCCPERDRKPETASFARSMIAKMTASWVSS